MREPVRPSAAADLEGVGEHEGVTDGPVDVGLVDALRDAPLDDAILKALETELEVVLRPLREVLRPTPGRGPSGS